jgi:hypothetical protein
MQFHFVGSANVAVEVLDNTGQVVDRAPNTIGNYDGSTIASLNSSSVYSSM